MGSWFWFTFEFAPFSWPEAINSFLAVIKTSRQWLGETQPQGMSQHIRWFLSSFFSKIQRFQTDVFVFLQKCLHYFQKSLQIITSNGKRNKLFSFSWVFWLRKWIKVQRNSVLLHQFTEIICCNQLNTLTTKICNFTLNF